MSDKPETETPSKKARQAAERKKRLEANLRTNLKRRKAQDRARTTEHSADPENP